MAAPTLYS